MPRSRPPAAVTAARVMVALDGLLSLMCAATGLGAGALVLLAGRRLGAYPAGEGPFGLASVAEAGGVLLVVGGLAAVLTGLRALVFVRLRRGDRGARDLLGGLIVVGFLAAVLYGAGTDQAFLGIVFFLLLPWGATQLALLRTAAARRFFEGSWPPQEAVRSSASAAGPSASSRARSAAAPVSTP